MLAYHGTGSMGVLTNIRGAVCVIFSWTIVFDGQYLSHLAAWQLCIESAVPSQCLRECSICAVTGCAGGTRPPSQIHRRVALSRPGPKRTTGFCQPFQSPDCYAGRAIGHAIAEKSAHGIVALGMFESLTKSARTKHASIDASRPTHMCVHVRSFSI